MRGDEVIWTWLYRTEYHVVWIPKYRPRTLNPGVRGHIRMLLPTVVSIRTNPLATIVFIPPTPIFYGS